MIHAYMYLYSHKEILLSLYKRYELLYVMDTLARFASKYMTRSQSFAKYDLLLLFSYRISCIIMFARSPFYVNSLNRHKKKNTENL